MAENKMSQVAEMFGKKLGEEFTVKGRYKNKIHCIFCKDGLRYHNGVVIEWQKVADYILTDLLTGKAVIVDD
jgi:hypothetical protein